uniref:Uncharacterized protein n=1 Tax=Streptomyces sp. NBC_00093 TaxID=2975649 RepID=A0AAU1ZTZ8_9ACTN
MSQRHRRDGRPDHPSPAHAKVLEHDTTRCLGRSPRGDTGQADALLWTAEQPGHPCHQACDALTHPDPPPPGGTPDRRLGVLSPLSPPLNRRTAARPAVRHTPTPVGGPAADRAPTAPSHRTNRRNS